MISTLGSKKRSRPLTITPNKLAAATPPGILLLDFDGTLTRLRIDPEAVRLSQTMRRSLIAAAAVRPVVIVSGRPLAFLQRVAGSLPVTLVGSHGAESSRKGFAGVRKPAIPTWARKVATAASQEGLLVEEKPFGLVLHYRHRSKSEWASLEKRWLAALASVAAPGWQVLPGSGIVELRVAGIDKGAVVEPLRKSFGQPIAAALGDDRTDEDMFAALHPGELGVLVGPRRPSRARYDLSGIRAVADYLQALAISKS